MAACVPIGYAYLQTGHYDQAIRSLQACLTATPDSAAVYGYLGDAYTLRGETDVARRVYLEACLIDPETID
jgi:Tfp pilus assembly protein PilF